ncbi:hypothetical protein JANAI62_22400 [Jannaschia pagri]|uniref:5-aminolevulic acid synthase n=1 Tax=Jannaschia pagri TaxID=2829797 RepID=A0ABQ4NMI6_9RHOB|nr:MULTISPECIES: 5-aminolevulic acid synthase [unclassified Jannaschia]GIT91783.1 hypothetical protein JANAI61_22410 [Jannaschia sp. AI_61]GIT95617.1 hypothetical protein JANAI62_22400 [Jannaschia sp. AI_62]
MIRAALMSLVIACPAMAQEVPNQAQAKRDLFGTRTSTLEVTPQPFLSDLDLATLREMPKLASLKYYGALAVDPDAGLQNEASTGAFNYHSLEAARAAAVEGCSAKAGGRSCVVVAEITPRRFREGRSLTLSQDASRAVAGRDFRRAGANAALALSPSTGAWGLGDGGDAALAACAAGGARDCEVAVAN